MTDKALEAKRKYEREWRRNNPDKVRAMKERYWAKKAAQLQAEAEAEAENTEKSEE